MQKKELNEYILHYLVSDKTHSAIMLTGDWGTGKSFYVQNDLIPYLEQDEDYYKKNHVVIPEGTSKYNCIVISLYGITQMSEISKTIYFEIRTSRIKKWTLLQKLNQYLPKNVKSIGKEAVMLGKGYGKTIIKGLAEQRGIEIGISDKDLHSLFDSINMSGRLLIFEDIERTQIDIFEFLGYVNSLVEQDNVKVLLIANETKFIRYKPEVDSLRDENKGITQEGKSEKRKPKEYDEDTLKYLSIKEKTISDTLYYQADLDSAIKQIIGNFSNSYLLEFSKDYYISNIKEIMQIMNNYNLRSFIFACQKISDIYEYIDDKDNRDFLECICYSVIAFSFQCKNKGSLLWEERDECSFDLGLPYYPLFRFCYDYIVFHSFQKEKIKESIGILQELRLYDANKSRNDPDLITIYDYHVQEEKTVRKAILSIQQKLEVEGAIAFSEYGRLAMYLIRLSRILDFDLNYIKGIMIKNLYGKGDKLRPEALSNVIEKDKDESITNEFRLFKEEMRASLLHQDIPLFHFDYTTETVEQFSKYVMENKNEIVHTGEFLCKLNIKKLIETMKQCSAKQLDDIRGVFIAIYKTNIPEKDVQSLREFGHELESLLNYPSFDKIQNLQIQLFINNVKKIWSDNEFRT